MYRYYADLPARCVFDGVPKRQVLALKGRVGVEVGRCLLAKDDGERSTQALRQIVVDSDGRLRSDLPRPTNCRLLEEAPFKNGSAAEAAPAASE
eukprot:12932363-Alexandrium_andersonii.AAC.1